MNNITYKIKSENINQLSKYKKYKIYIYIYWIYCKTGNQGRSEDQARIGFF